VTQHQVKSIYICHTVKGTDSKIRGKTAKLFTTNGVLESNKKDVCLYGEFMLKQWYISTEIRNITAGETEFHKCNGH
jgi:hypothetical protein